jgi:hypothetical protein
MWKVRIYESTNLQYTEHPFVLTLLAVKPAPRQHRHRLLSRAHNVRRGRERPPLARCHQPLTVLSSTDNHDSSCASRRFLHSPRLRRTRSVANKQQFTNSCYAPSSAFSSLTVFYILFVFLRNSVLGFMLVCCIVWGCAAIIGRQPRTHFVRGSWVDTCLPVV